MLQFIIVLVLLGVAANQPLSAKSDLQYKWLSKPPVIGGRVLNGSEAVPHSRPYEAYIVFEPNFPWFCGGALISKNYVLTAGHCVSGATSAVVLLGAHNVSKDEITQAAYAAIEFVLHDGYDKDKILFDIGLVKLRVSVELTSAIQIITLPSKSDADKTYEDETVTISGWGLTKGDDWYPSDVLMEVNVNVIDLDSCRAYFSGVQEYQICTSGIGGKGACNGDYGSPVVYNDVVIGLVSYGTEHCVSGYPTTSTSTGYLLDWIEQNSDVTLV